jgi:ribosomal protein L24E
MSRSDARVAPEGGAEGKAGRRKAWSGLSADCRCDYCGRPIKDGETLRVYSTNGEEVDMWFDHVKCPKNRRVEKERRIHAERRGR